jgi:hypothetical protein
MRRWLLLGETNEQGSWTETLDGTDTSFERLAQFTSDDEEPTDEELAEHLEGRDGEFLLIPLDAGRVVRATTTTSVEVNVERMGVYS